MAGSGQGRTGDIKEMCRLSGASSLQGKGKAIPCDVSASTLVSKETVKKVVF